MHMWSFADLHEVWGPLWGVSWELLISIPAGQAKGELRT